MERPRDLLLEAKWEFLRFSALPRIRLCVCVYDTCIYIHVCESGSAWATMHVEINGRPWVSVLAFHLLGDRVSVFVSA